MWWVLIGSVAMSATKLYSWRNKGNNSIFLLEMSPPFTSAAYFQVQFRLDFIMGANTMNPEQTAPKGAV